MNGLMQISSIYERKVFTIDEACKELLPLIILVSKKSKERMKTDKDEMKRWGENMRRLGVEPIGPYKVRILGQDCWYLWEGGDKLFFMENL